MRVGDTVRFVPAAWTRFSGANTLEAFGVRQRVKGVIVGIHKRHRWCRVRYKTHGVIQHECFKIIQESLEDQKNANDGNT